MGIKKILLVDDSPAQLVEMKKALSDVNAIIITATDGNEAVAKAKADQPDLIFLDIVMDGLDGYGACREITRADETKHIPVIFVSTKDQRADKIWADKQGAKGMIHKPFTKEDLIAEVNKYS